MQQSYHVQKILFNSGPPGSLVLTIFLFPLLPEPWGRGCDSNIPFVAEHSTDGYSLSFDEL